MVRLIDFFGLILEKILTYTEIQTIDFLSLREIMNRARKKFSAEADAMRKING